MPTSFYSSITDVMTMILSLDPLPASVLDVGIGEGKYGLLCREYLPHWRRKQSASPAFRLDGVEPAVSRINSLHRELYDEIYTEPAETLLPTLPDNAYEIALFMDAIEHLDRTPAAEALRQLQRIAPVVIVTTPGFFYPQPGSEDDPFGRHRSYWSTGDLRRAGALHVLKREASIAIFARPPFRDTWRRRFEIQRLKDRWMPARLRAYAYSRSRKTSP